MFPEYPMENKNVPEREKYYIIQKA